jgi:hypothetical protein
LNVYVQQLKSEFSKFPLKLLVHIVDDFWKASWELQTAVFKAALELYKLAFKGGTRAVLEKLLKLLIIKAREFK